MSKRAGSKATLVLVAEVLGLAFIGLVSVASFSVMAQRRLRALGMLSAIGATDRNLRLVMIANGLVVGVAAALAGTAAGLGAWFAYAPTLQQATGHAVDAASLPWWAFALGIGFAIATSVLASRPPGQDNGRSAGGGRAVRPGRRRRRYTGPPCRASSRSRSASPAWRSLAAWPGRRAVKASPAVPAGRPGRRHRRDHPARPAGPQRTDRRGRATDAGRGPDRAA